MRLELIRGTNDVYRLFYRNCLLFDRDYDGRPLTLAGVRQETNRLLASLESSLPHARAS
jgi:hypothetical protein